ncbi:MULTISPECIES: 16S rRNA (guanine(527)-N(7))-methyltransferase RsmG [unclassified Mycoplasma]|uniref:16S rRNA (guanine(527)-N(7))-methyltransferase RsmG n=1 Tax=unclassified Mycoplasma TaxID=2683645 RepID=UPI00216AC0A8|nr:MULTISPECIES: 16S rRNA (guanine(527)-N(7))-methyltransferase RsmG [unclassified Mycoplasma]MCS4536817.1 16S rRNA (guanine(527)-N(7))-methyltransferase RsmG [Mycoplasma sp. CSL7475-4]MCT4469800.1 16S rRNA (guanine(527)-N(7))-methyltransferase RsmG [Mycoplasma sp. HS2188]
MNEKTQKYINIIHEFNQHKNITGFKSIDELKNQGVLDSIKVMDVAHEIGFDYTNKHVADIGAGAGFPSLPHLLENNNYYLTIIEGMQSRCEFLESVKNQLNVENFTIINARAENTKEYARQFDLVTARAVSSVKNMYMLTHHLLKDNGYLYLPKGKKFSDELNEFFNKFPDEKENTFVLKYTNSLNEDSFVVVIKKVLPTPKKWPLSWKQIKDY